ncbi:MAG: hypothetical protein FWE02_00335 [Defluviitaleaceae bacterium]|nr:hypothetical protein [Defluviitaleaceae bacterium]
MSLPKFPDKLNWTREEALTAIIVSVAMEEAAISKILENIKPCEPCGETKFLVDSLLDLEIVLKSKLRLALEMMEKSKPPKPKPCPPKPIPICETYHVKKGCIRPCDFLRFDRPIILRRGEVDVNIKLILSVPAKFDVIIESCGKIIERIMVNEAKAQFALSLKNDSILKIKFLGEHSIKILEGTLKINASNYR